MNSLWQSKFMRFGKPVVAERAWGSCAAGAVKASGLAGQTPLRLKETTQLLPSSHALLIDMFGEPPDTIVCWQDCRARKQLVALNMCLGMQESCRQCTSCTRGGSSAAPSRMPRNLWRSLVGACSLRVPRQQIHLMTTDSRDSTCLLHLSLAFMTALELGPLHPCTGCGDA